MLRLYGSLAGIDRRSLRLPGSALCPIDTRQSRRGLQAGRARLLHYDCVIKLMNARTSEPLAGVTLMVGADMPSMPMIYNVRPVKAAPGADSGTDQARLVLEMHGDWAVQLNLSGPVRDRVIANIRFDPDRATPMVPSRARPSHKH